MTTQERFNSKFVVAENGCHLWTKSTDSKGYGWFSINNVNRRAHAVAYEWANGPVPDGLQIDHLCRVPGCVNPDHLEAVPSRVNTIRGTSPAALNRAKTHCLRGHPLSGDNLRIYTNKRGTQRVCRACRKIRA